LKITKIFTDKDGETHFKDVEVELESIEFAPPAPPMNLSKFYPASNYAFAFFPSGWYVDWHPTPRRQICFILSGQSEAQVSDGEVRRFNPGSIILLEDTSGKGHVSRVVGSIDHLVAIVQLPD
jgi:hypothetical protein